MYIMSRQECNFSVGFYIVLITVSTVEMACPVSHITVIDMCDATTLRGKSFHIDSAKMADGYNQCSCNLTTNFSHSLSLVDAIPATQCQAYWYNVTISLGQDLETIPYEFKNGRCGFPQILGTISQSSLPWFLSITRRSDGLVAPRDGDPGFCLEVFSIQEKEFTLDCGDIVLPPIQTTTIETTSGVADIHTTTASTATVVIDSVATVMVETSASIPDDNVTSSTSVTNGNTYTSEIHQTTESSIAADVRRSTLTTTDIPMTSVMSTNEPESTAPTLSSHPSPPQPPQPPQPPSPPPPSQPQTTATIDPSSITTDDQSTAMTSASGDIAGRHGVKTGQVDGIIIGATVASIILFIIILAACIYMSRNMTKKYTRKDVENVVYVPYQSPK